MSKRKIIISSAIAAAAIAAILLFIAFNKNHQENTITIETAKNLNMPLSVIMKEHGEETVLFSSKTIKSGTNKINIAENHGEFSLALKINDEEQILFGYGVASAKKLIIDLAIKVEGDDIIVDTKTSTSIDEQKGKLVFHGKD